MLNMNRLTVSDLENLPQPVSMGARHRPLPHHRFAKVIDNTLHDHGIEVIESDLQTSHEHKRIFGTYYLRAPGMVQKLGDSVPGRVMPMLGWKNSTDQVIGGRVAMAGYVSNCSNGMWFIERGCEVRRKNTMHAESGLQELMRVMMRDYWETYMQVIDHQLELAETALADRDAHDLICRGVRQGITATRHAGRVLDAWHDTPFDWGSKSLWRLHNCHTYVMDREVRNPYVRSKRNLLLNDMMASAQLN